MVSTPQRQITDTEKLMALRKDYAALEQRFDALSTKFSAMVEENATLRKRLEPIEIVYRNWHDYKGDSPMRFADYMSAIYRCMELKEDW